MSIEERFVFVMGEIMRASNVSNDDPMRFSKRCAVDAARAAMRNGIEQAFETLRIANAIEHDTREQRKQEGV